MHGNRIGNFQFCQVFLAIGNAAVIHLHPHCPLCRIDGGHNSHVAVIGAHAGLAAVPLKGNIVVVAHLHHLVPYPEHAAGGFDLGQAGTGRIETLLQLLIELHGAHRADLGGAQHLDIPDRVKAIAAGQPGADQVAHQLLAGSAVRFDHEEIIVLAAVEQRFALHDPVGIGDDQAFGGLAENLIQADGGKTACPEHLSQNIARPYAGQLVGIPYHNDAAAHPQRGQQALEQFDVHHTHLVQNHRVTAQQILFVMNEPHHTAGIVHLQQAVDGGSPMAGEFFQPFGGPAGGGAERHPFALMLQQRNDGIDGGGFAGARPAGEHHHPAGHRHPDGFPLGGRIGKSLAPFQRLQVDLHVPGRLGRMCSQIPQPGGDVLLCAEKVR